MTFPQVQKMARGIRRRVLEHTVKHNGGYLSQACSSAEILSVLYLRKMNLSIPTTPIVPTPFAGVPGPQNKNYSTGAHYNGLKREDLDRFFLSPAQYALVLYAALIECGRMNEKALDEFNKDGSIVEMIGAEHSPGMESMTGSLGQGISQAAGAAFARKFKQESGRVFVFMSDGEFQSGQTWEAIQAMSFHKVDNLCIFVDVNGCQCDGKMSDIMNIEPFQDRLQAFGARTISVDGHDLEALDKIDCFVGDGRPTVVLCYTNPCQDMPILKDRAPKFHYVRFTSNEEREKYYDYRI